MLIISEDVCVKVHLSFLVSTLHTSRKYTEFSNTDCLKGWPDTFEKVKLYMYTHVWYSWGDNILSYHKRKLCHMNAVIIWHNQHKMICGVTCHDESNIASNVCMRIWGCDVWVSLPWNQTKELVQHGFTTCCTPEDGDESIDIGWHALMPICRLSRAHKDLSALACILPQD